MKDDDDEHEHLKEDEDEHLTLRIYSINSFPV